MFFPYCIWRLKHAILYGIIIYAAAAGGVRLRVELHEPTEAAFSAAAVDLKPPEASSAGIFKLMVVTDASSTKKIEVTFAAA